MDRIRTRKWSLPWQWNSAFGASVAVGLGYTTIYFLLTDSSFQAYLPPLDMYPGAFIVVWAFFAVLPVLVGALPTFLFLRYVLVVPMATLVSTTLYTVSTGGTVPTGVAEFEIFAMLFLLVSLAVGEISVRGLVAGRWRVPLSQASIRAVKIGVFVALVYTFLVTVVFTLLAAVNVINPVPAEPPFAGPPTPIDQLVEFFVLTLVFFVLYIIGVGLPVGLFIRFRMVVPLIGAILLGVAVPLVWVILFVPDETNIIFLLMIPAIGIAVSLFGLVEHLLKWTLSER